MTGQVPVVEKRGVQNVATETLRWCYCPEFELPLCLVDVRGHPWDEILGVLIYAMDSACF